jgi:DNA-binding CsgD family transcriptional regulator
MLLLSRKEKVEMVIRLAKEGKTTREIAKIVHMSLKDIGKILQKITGDEDPKIESDKLRRQLNLSDYAKAFQMFMQNKSLPEIIVSLDIDVNTVQAYYCDYLRLMNMKNLVDIYKEIGSDLSLFLYLYRQIKKEELNKQEIVDLIQNQRKFIDMEKTIDLLYNHINYLREEKEELKESIKNYLEDRERIASYRQ